MYTVTTVLKVISLFLQLSFQNKDYTNKFLMNSIFIMLKISENRFTKNTKKF